MSKRIVKDERGVAMTEFALILPVFILVIAGLLSFGRVFFYWISANHLANETARWVIVDRNPYSTNLQYHARYSGGTAEFTDARVCIGYRGKAESAIDLGDPVDVIVEKPFSLVPILNAGSITIRGTSTMRIERLGGTSGPAEYRYSDNAGSTGGNGTYGQDGQGNWRCQ